MRKLLFVLLLPFFVLLSQQGAVTHEVSHIADFVARANAANGTNAAHAADGSPGREATRGGDHRANDLQCEACLAFAQLAGVVTAQVFAPVLPSFSFHFAPSEAPACIAADAPSARSRGPPLSA